jgi:hypothetical protein
MALELRAVEFVPPGEFRDGAGTDPLAGVQPSMVDANLLPQRNHPCPLLSGRFDLEQGELPLQMVGAVLPLMVNAKLPGG